MKPLSEQLVKTKKALLEFDAGQPDRDAIIDNAITIEHADQYYMATVIAVEKVQSAFYQDCKKNGIPNNWSHCKLVDISTLKRWCAGEKTG